MPPPFPSGGRETTLLLWPRPGPRSGRPQQHVRAGEKSGPVAHPKKQPKGIGKHPLGNQWDMFAESAISILDTKAVKWTPIDAVRIGYEEERSFPTLWIAVLYYRCYASGI